MPIDSLKLPLTLPRRRIMFTFIHTLTNTHTASPAYTHTLSFTHFRSIKSHSVRRAHAQLCQGWRGKLACTHTRPALWPCFSAELHSIKMPAKGCESMAVTWRACVTCTDGPCAWPWAERPQSQPGSRRTEFIITTEMIPYKMHYKNMLV